MSKHRLLALLLLFLLGYVQAVSAEDWAINAGLSGAWADPATPGQGLFLDVDPTNRVIFLTWFTYGEVDTQVAFTIGHPGNRWYIAMGSFTETSATLTMDLLETEGGFFDDPTSVTTMPVGSLSLNFLNCREALMDFTFDDGRADGHADLTRLSSAEVCEAIADSSDSVASEGTR